MRSCGGAFSRTVRRSGISGRRNGFGPRFAASKARIRQPICPDPPSSFPPRKAAVAFRLNGIMRANRRRRLSGCSIDLISREDRAADPEFGHGLSTVVRKTGRSGEGRVSDIADFVDDFAGRSDTKSIRSRSGDLPPLETICKLAQTAGRTDRLRLGNKGTAMKTIKGPGIFLAQFVGGAPPFDSLDGLARWAAGLGYVGLQLPDHRRPVRPRKGPPPRKPMLTS